MGRTAAMTGRRETDRIRTRFTICRLGFSLLETTVSLLIIVVILGGVAAYSASIERTWRRHQLIVTRLRDMQWVLDMIGREVAMGTASASPGWARLRLFVSGAGERLPEFSIDADGDGWPETDRIIYWRGSGGSSGPREMFYRQHGPKSGWWTRGVPCFYGVVDNPSGNENFDMINNVLIVELTTRPDPTRPAGKDNPDFTVIGFFRPRN